jgi:hypothetical protein
MGATGTFKDVVKRDRAAARALPIDEYLAELDGFIDAHSPYTQNKVVPAKGEGTSRSTPTRRRSTATRRSR